MKALRAVGEVGVCALLLVAAMLGACAEPPAAARFEVDTAAMPVAFDRRAGYVRFDHDGTPTFEPLLTSQPVMQFAGANLDGSLVAYTSLAAHRSTGEYSATVSLEAALDLPLSDLVPTGVLVIEDPRGATRTIGRTESYIVAAAWHPARPRVLAYSYMQGGEYGLAVYDTDEKRTLELFRGDLTPETLAWSDDGRYVGAYIVDPELARLERPEHSESSYDFQHRWQYVAADAGGGPNAPTFDRNHARFAPQDAAMSVAFMNGGTVHLENGPTSTAATLDHPMKAGGGHVTFRADQLRHLSRKGMAFVNYEADHAELRATNGTRLPEILGVSSLVSYYIPMHASEDTTITQVGSGYGGGCLVWNHTGTLSHAVDFQIPTTSYDEIIASGNGTTAGMTSSWTCNAMDTSGCASYSSSCGTSWGNYAILAHSDGRYTLYAHVESTNFKVTASGRSASAGCWLADEGATGNTTGNKNGCGDHLHFQWQNSGALNAQSVSGSFVETSLSSGSCGPRSTLSGIMSCVL